MTVKRKHVQNFRVICDSRMLLKGQQNFKLVHKSNRAKKNEQDVFSTTDFLTLDVKTEP